jgi:hypothetical protein
MQSIRNTDWEKIPRTAPVAPGVENARMPRFAAGRRHLYNDAGKRSCWHFSTLLQDSCI